MTEPIKSDRNAHASSPYLNAYIQKQRLAQAASGLPASKSSGPARVYETRRADLARGGQVHGDANASDAASDSSDWVQERSSGEIYREDRPIDRLHQFQIERGIDQEALEGDENPYDDSADDSPDHSMKAPSDLH